MIKVHHENCFIEGQHAYLTTQADFDKAAATFRANHPEIYTPRPDYTGCDPDFLPQQKRFSPPR